MAALGESGAPDPVIGLVIRRCKSVQPEPEVKVNEGIRFPALTYPVSTRLELAQ